MEVSEQAGKRAKKVVIHKNTIVTPKGREKMVRRLDCMVAAVVAAGFGVSLYIARK